MPTNNLIEIFIMLAGSFILGYLWRGVSTGSKAIAQIAKQEPDNLEKITGLTQRSKELLHDSAIYSFRQLAATDVKRLKEILTDGGVKKVDPSNWPKEAAVLRDRK